MTGHPIQLCVTHDHELWGGVADQLRTRGFNIVSPEVVQVKVEPDPNVRRGAPEYDAVSRRIERLPAGCNAYTNWEYHDHYALNRSRSHLSIETARQFSSMMRSRGCRSGIYSPMRIQHNSMQATSRTSLENARIMSHIHDYLVLVGYVPVAFDRDDSVGDRYVLNTLACVQRLREVMRPGCELMIAFQLSVRGQGGSRTPMSPYQATTVGATIAAAGATPLWWFEAKDDSGRDTIPDRLEEVDRLGSHLLDGLSRHRVVPN